jgi:GTPase SAR1 family protein
MNRIKIGVSGAHSTGKTTFIRNLEKRLIQKSIKYKIVSDLAVKCPLPILTEHTIESTLWIASKSITEEVEAEKDFLLVIADRPILDCWAYFNAVCKNQYKENDPRLLTLKSMIEHWLKTYDLIYQTEIDETIPVENSKGRMLDPAYRKKIGEEMFEATKFFGINPKRLTSLNTEIECEFLVDFIISRMK